MKTSAENIMLISQSGLKTVRIKSVIVVTIIWFACIISGSMLYLNYRKTADDVNEALFLTKSKLTGTSIDIDNIKSESYFLVFNNKLLTITRRIKSNNKQEPPVGKATPGGNTNKPVPVKRPRPDKGNNSGFSILPLPKK